MNDRLGFAARIERSLSLVVGLAAIVAALVSLYQASLARQQSRAAAWPVLMGGSSLATGKPYSYVLANKGVGPARIRTVRVLVDGKDIATWTDALKRFTGLTAVGYEYSYVGPGSVMSPGSADTLLSIPAGANAFTFWREANKRLTVSLCYCSVYDECWLTGEQSLEPKPVRRCPPIVGKTFMQ
jgi:hypothetical protein